jgi:carbamate kinase
MSADGKLAVVAVGGNSLIRDRDHLSIPDQYEAVAETSRHIAGMIAAGWNVVVTHGSGPQMGFILRRSELAIHEVSPVPMDYAGADLQGAIGYMFMKALTNAFRERNVARRAIAVVTQTLVDRHDPAFATPTKPIGSHMDEATARRRADELGWEVRDDAGRGWRRVVPSPVPKAILELDVIRFLAGNGYVVIGCGGGGVPVLADEHGDIRGVEAVVDKDLASSLLARELGADVLLVSTAVEKVALDFNKPGQRWVDRMTVSEARRHDAEDQFDRGSMGPKIQALVAYVAASGGKGLITNPPNIVRALAGETGTAIVPD